MILQRRWLQPLICNVYHLVNEWIITIIITEVKNSITSHLVLLLLWRIWLHGSNNLLQRGWRYTKNLLHIRRKYLNTGQAPCGRHGQAKKVFKVEKMYHYRVI